MTKTVTSLFRDHSQATATVSRLEQAGISRSKIDVMTSTSGDLTGRLSGYGIPASDAHAYAEGVRRGGSLITVTCTDSEVDRVLDILEADEAILDVDKQQESWRAEGWQGHEIASATATGSSAGTGFNTALTGGSPRSASQTSEARSGLASRTGTSGREEVIPIAEEELHVGKREVNRGRIRIHSRIVETPIQEQVTLRDETLKVERRPVEGVSRAGAVTGDPFQERTIEVEERDEEAVISKEVRVKEELVIRKDVEQRSETVSDTVRKTEVDVEDGRQTRDKGTLGSTDRKR